MYTHLYITKQKKVTNHTDKSKRMLRIGCVIVENSREKTDDKDDISKKMGSFIMSKILEINIHVLIGHI